MPGDDTVDLRSSEVDLAEGVQRDQFHLSDSAMEGKVGLGGYQDIRKKPMKIAKLTM
jgi:hypothetical protein